MDIAKAIGCLVTNFEPLSEHEGTEKYSNPALPAIALPTTAGTGSEISFGAVVYDEERKYSFFSEVRCKSRGWQS